MARFLLHTVQQHQRELVVIRRLFSSAVAGIAFAASATAFAVPIDFKLASAFASASGFELGTTVTVTPNNALTDLPFTLFTDGGPNSRTFDFLDVKVSGIGITAGTIEASLNFATPDVTANGVFGGFAVILGLVSGGSLSVLADPKPIPFGNGGWFDVDFHGFTTKCAFCTSLSGTVTATVSLLKAPTTAVPEPGTLALLGVGLLVAGLARRRHI